MDTKINEKKGNGKAKDLGEIELYKDSIKQSLYKAIGTAIDDETELARKEMIKERENAIKLIADEERDVIKKIVEDEKKVIWEKVLETQKSESLNEEAIKESIAKAYMAEQSNENKGNGNKTVTEEDQETDAGIEKVDLEILPPRDQDEIAVINTYLINMPEVLKVELATLVDKSILKVQLSKPVDFIEKLSSLPQILNAEEVNEDGRKRIMITLMAKSKLERNFVQVNDKVNKIFHKKQ